MRKFVCFPLVGQRSTLHPSLFVLDKPSSQCCRLSIDEFASSKSLPHRHWHHHHAKVSSAMPPPPPPPPPSHLSSKQMKGVVVRATRPFGKRQQWISQVSYFSPFNHQKISTSMLALRSITSNLLSVVTQRGLFGPAVEVMTGGSGGGSGGGNQQKTQDTTMNNNKSSEKLLAQSKCVEQIEIRACGRLYAELVKSKPILYSNAPKDEGIVFKVQYYDSLKALPTQPTATVCILHGAPGHYEEFTSLINSLTGRGIRVVAPNFPDYNATYQHSFRHSPRERADFLLEFLKKLKVHQIDMLIGHSASVYTIFQLLEHSYSNKKEVAWTTSQDFRVIISSLGLLCTPSHELPRNLAVTPWRLFSLKLFDYPILRPFIITFIGWWVKVSGIKNRVDKNKIENLLIAASTVGYSEHNKMAPRLELLKHHQIPTLLVYGTRDRLVAVDRFEQLQRDLGVDDNARVREYDADGRLVKDRDEQDSTNARLVDVSRFEAGGHYVFQRHAEQVNRDVYEFLQARTLRGQQKKDREETRL